MGQEIDEKVRDKIKGRIKKLRGERDLTQEQFADFLNENGLAIGVTALKQWERLSEHSLPTIDKMIAIADACGYSVDYLCGKDERTPFFKDMENFTGLSEKSLVALHLHSEDESEAIAINTVLAHSVDLIEYMDEIRQIKHGYDKDIAPIFEEYPNIRRAYKKALRQTITDNTKGEEVFYSLIQDEHYCIDGLSEKRTAEWIYRIAYMYEGLKNRKYEIVEIMDNIISDYTREMEQIEDKRITVTSIEDALSEDTERE